MAARVSDLARGTETVFTETLLDEPGVGDIVAQHTVEPFRANVRGLDQEFTNYRLIFLPL